MRPNFKSSENDVEYFDSLENCSDLKRGLQRGVLGRVVPNYRRNHAALSKNLLIERSFLGLIFDNN